MPCSGMLASAEWSTSCDPTLRGCSAQMSDTRSRHDTAVRCSLLKSDTPWQVSNKVVWREYASGLLCAPLPAILCSREVAHLRYDPVLQEADQLSYWAHADDTVEISCDHLGISQPGAISEALRPQNPLTNGFGSDMLQTNWVRWTGRRLCVDFAPADALHRISDIGLEPAAQELLSSGRCTRISA